MNKLIIMCQASLTIGSKHLTRYYNADAVIIGTVAEATFSDLPLNARMHIEDSFSSCKVGSIKYFEDNKSADTGMKLYGKEFTDEDSYFIEMSSEQEQFVMKADLSGNVSFFTHLS